MMETMLASKAIPIVQEWRCTGCGLCEDLCPTGAVRIVGGTAMIVRPQACTFCEVCESYCPEGAIGRPFSITFATDEIRVASDE